MWMYNKELKKVGIILIQILNLKVKKLTREIKFFLIMCHWLKFKTYLFIYIYIYIYIYNIKSVSKMCLYFAVGISVRNNFFIHKQSFFP